MHPRLNYESVQLSCHASLHDIQKYEKAVKKVSAKIIHLISNVLRSMH